MLYYYYYFYFYCIKQAASFSIRISTSNGAINQSTLAITFAAFLFVYLFVYDIKNFS